MTSFINNPIRNSIILYLILIFFIIYTKHRMIYDTDNNFKTFGLSETKTIFPFCLVSALFAILSYYFFTLLRIIF